LPFLAGEDVEVAVVVEVCEDYQVELDALGPGYVMGGPLAGRGRAGAGHPHHAREGGRGALAGEHEVRPRVEVDVAHGDGLGRAGAGGKGDSAGLPGLAFGVLAAKEDQVARLGGGDDVAAPVAVEVGVVEEQAFPVGAADGVDFPRPGLGFAGAWVLQPVDAAVFSVAVGKEDVLPAVGVHVCRDNGHDPAGVAQFVILPRLHVSRIGWRLEPPDGGAAAFRAGDEIQAVPAVELDRDDEHPSHPQRGRQGGGGPLVGIGVSGAGFRRPVYGDSPGASLGRGDDIDAAVAVEVSEDGVFEASDLADRDGRPFAANLAVAGMDIRANDSAFLPAGGDVGQPVAVDVEDLHAVGAAGRIVDGVPLPRLVRSPIRRPGGLGKCGADEGRAGQNRREIFAFHLQLQLEQFTLICSTRPACGVAGRRQPASTMLRHRVLRLPCPACPRRRPDRYI